MYDRIHMLRSEYYCHRSCLYFGFSVHYFYVSLKQYTRWQHTYFFFKSNIGFMKLGWIILVLCIVMGTIFLPFDGYGLIGPEPRTLEQMQFLPKRMLAIPTLGSHTMRSFPSFQRYVWTCIYFTLQFGYIFSFLTTGAVLGVWSCLFFHFSEIC